MYKQILGEDIIKKQAKEILRYIFTSGIILMSIFIIRIFMVFNFVIQFLSSFSVVFYLKIDTDLTRKKWPCFPVFVQKNMALRLIVLTRHFCSSSGRPAMLVSRLRTPDSAAALPTIAQLTSPITAAVPTVATAVCATVFTARIPAALIHLLQYALSITISFQRDSLRSRTSC